MDGGGPSWRKKDCHGGPVLLYWQKNDSFLFQIQMLLDDNPAHNVIRQAKEDTPDIGS